MERFLSRSYEGQVSIEIVIITSAIFLIALLVFANYFSISDETIALVILKAETIKELNKLDGPYMIGKIQSEDCGAAGVEFNVITIPADIDESDVEADYIKNRIAERTKWDAADITLEVNGSISC